MIVYLFLIIVLLIEATFVFSTEKIRKKSKTYSIIAFVQLFIISALRSRNIGNDTYKYLSLFDISNITSDITLLTNRYGFGYIMLNKIIYFFSHESQWLIIVTSFITLLLFTRFIYKTSSNVWLSIYLFITLMFYYFTMSGLRQALAMALIVTSYEFLKKRKLIPYMLVIFVASQIHSIAIIFIFIYPLSYLKFNMKNVVIILVGGFIVFFTFDLALSFVIRCFPQYKYYLGSRYFEANNTANIVNAIIPMFILIFGWIFKYHRSDIDISHMCKDQRDLTTINNSNIESAKCKKNRHKFFKIKILIKENHMLSFLVLLGMVFSIISIRASVIDRVYYYFAIFNIIYIPNVLNTIKNKENKFLITFVIVCIALLYNFTIFIFRPEWNRVFPYEFFWNA